MELGYWPYHSTIEACLICTCLGGHSQQSSAWYNTKWQNRTPNPTRRNQTRTHALMHSGLRSPLLIYFLVCDAVVVSLHHSVQQKTPLHKTVERIMWIQYLTSLGRINILLLSLSSEKRRGSCGIIFGTIIIVMCVMRVHFLWLKQKSVYTHAGGLHTWMLVFLHTMTKLLVLYEGYCCPTHCLLLTFSFDLGWL